MPGMEPASEVTARASLQARQPQRDGDTPSVLLILCFFAAVIPETLTLSCYRAESSSVSA